MRWLAHVIFAGCLAWPIAARAQASSEPACEADPETCGRRAFDAGVEAYKRNAWREALGHFKAAYAIKRYPIVIYNLALTEEKLGLYVEALSHAKELGLAPDRTPELTQKAKEVEQRASGQVATLTIDLPNARDVRLFVDNQAMPEFENIRVNPGKHRVRVTADGRERIKREIDAQSGEKLVLTLDAAQNVVTHRGDESSKQPSGEPDDQTETAKRGLSPTWFYVAAGATIVVGGISVWSGIDTLNKKKDFDNAPADQKQKLLDDGHARERRTNILLITTGVLAAGTAALGLFVVDWGGNREKSVSLVPTLGGAMLVGRY